MAEQLTKILIIEDEPITESRTSTGTGTVAVAVAVAEVRSSRPMA